MGIKLMRLRDSERGVGHLLLIIVIVLVLGGVGFAGYTVMQKNNDSTKNSNASTNGGDTELTALDDECVAQYHDEIICRLASHPDLDKIAYEAVVTMTGADGESTTMTVKSDGKGNTATSGSFGGLQVESVDLDDHYYLLTDGTWYDYGSNDNGAEDPTEDVKFDVSDGIQYTNLGKEACGSGTCYKYSMTGELVGEGEHLVWFDDDDYKIRKWVSTGGTTGSMTMTFDYKSVTITKPSGVKSINELYSSGLNQ